MTNPVDRWLEWMLGIEEAVSGEGTAWRLVPSWPWTESWAAWLAVAFALATVAFVFSIYRFEGSARPGWKIVLGVLRMLLVFVVAFVLLPGWMISIERTGLPFVVVMIDDSAIMNLVDRYDDEALRNLIAQKVKDAGFDSGTRLNQARAILRADNGALLKTIEKNYRLKVYHVSEAAVAQSGDAAEVLSQLDTMKPHGAQSRLGVGVRTALNDLRGTSPSAIILLTDGITTDGEKLSEVAAYARQKNVHLLTVGLGSEQPIRDLELHDVVVDEVVFVDDIVYFAFTITGTGFEGREVEVRLREKNKDKTLAKITATIGPDGKSQQLRIPYRPAEVGEFDYVVEIADQEKDANPDNNREQRHVSVRKERIRVLLVQAYPSFEFRYLKTMLERDRTIKLSTVLQEADERYADLDKSALAVFPVAKEKLYEYDVVLFGDVDPGFLSAAVTANLVSFVKEKGGGVIFFSGPHFTPLSYAGTPLTELFPVSLDSARAPSPQTAIAKSFKPRVTELGRTSPHMQLGDNAKQTDELWRNLPGLYWLLEADDLKPGARVLAEHPDRSGPRGKKLPVIVLQPVGAGTVLFHASDDTWRWRYQVGDVYFARYWVQAIRFLSRSKLLGKDKKAELASDRREYRRGQPVRLRVRFLDQSSAPPEDDGVTVVLERGAAKERVTLRRTPTSRADFEGTLSDAAEGNYHAWLAAPSLVGAAPSVDFRVEAPPGESERLQMDVMELKRAAADTKGQFFSFATAHNVLDHIPPGRRVPVESVPPYPIWNKWPLLALCTLLAVSEWIMRKRKGML